MKFQAKLEKAETIEDCGASKECDESQVLLRVKDPLAALYPFVGIVAEVRSLETLVFRGKFEIRVFSNILVHIFMILTRLAFLEG